jgi:hypothetical protein
MSQSSKKKPRKPLSSRRSRKSFRYGEITFPQARGRRVEKIELLADSDHHSVTIRFQDKTDLEVQIDPTLAFSAVLYDWKSGSQRVLKRWPTIHSRVS